MEDRIIPRQTVIVTMSLSDGRTITGEIQINLNSRLSDFMNEPGDFVVVKENDGTTKLLNKQYIVDIHHN